MVVPTPAAAKITPSEASICGSTMAQPIEVGQTSALVDRSQDRRAQPRVAGDQRDDYAGPSSTSVTDFGSIRPLPLRG